MTHPIFLLYAIAIYLQSVFPSPIHYPRSLSASLHSSGPLLPPSWGILRYTVECEGDILSVPPLFHLRYKTLVVFINNPHVHITIRRCFATVFRQLFVVRNHGWSWSAPLHFIFVCLRGVPPGRVISPSWRGYQSPRVPKRRSGTARLVPIL